MKIWENKLCQKVSMLLICEKESQIQDLWNLESKSNINRSDSDSSTLIKTHVKLYVLHFFKQSTTFNGGSWSLIDKGIFYRATFNFKMLIFNVYKNVYYVYFCSTIFITMHIFLKEYLISTKYILYVLSFSLYSDTTLKRKV